MNLNQMTLDKTWD